jgi:hypothetical protein
VVLAWMMTQQTELSFKLLGTWHLAIGSIQALSCLSNIQRWSTQQYPSVPESTLVMEFKGSDRGPFVPALIIVDMQEDFCPPVSPRKIADHIALEKARTC